MSDAPERIWAVNFVDCRDARDAQGKYWHNSVHVGTEYVRADLHATLAAEVEQLRKERGEIRDAIAAIRDDAMRADNDLCAMEARAEKAEAEVERLMRLMNSKDAALERASSTASYLGKELDRAEASAAVNVKALEWKQRNDIPGLHSALGCDGWLRNIRRNKQGRFEYEGDPATTSYNETKFFNTLNEAKAAAQADYERRILSALTTEPAAPEGRQEAAAYGENIGGKIVSVRLDKSRHCTVPLYTRPAEQAVTEKRVRDAEAIVRSFAEDRLKSTTQWALDPRYLITLCDAVRSRPSEQVVTEAMPRLTEKMMRAACQAHFGSDNIDGIDITVHGRNWSFRDAFKRMWSAARKAAMEAGR